MPNRQIILFFAKALGVFGLWYGLYELWLLPDGRLDAWLSRNIVHVSGALLSGLGLEAFTAGRTVGLAGQPGIEIVDGCNGIASVGLFMGFVLAYPGRWGPRAGFIAFGVGVIWAVNIARITVLGLTQAWWPAFFSLTHDYSTTAIFYMAIFGLWMVWANVGGGRT